jgi:glycosyltransferase involved in cell wall biosynthesis
VFSVLHGFVRSGPDVRYRTGVPWDLIARSAEGMCRSPVSRLLRIGIISSIAHRTPPRSYGPWEQVASTLSEGLVALGHEVTLFATGDSVTTARLHAEAPHGYEEVGGYDTKAYEALHIAAAFERAHEFDVMSNQFDFLPLTYSRLVTTPVVTTIHGFSSEQILPVYRAYDDVARYVAISDADRHPDLSYEATIHHGIDVNAFTFRPELGDYLLFLGRIHPDKGTHLAIEVARRAGLPLVIAGIIQDQAYFKELVEPRLGSGDLSFLGPVEAAERDRLLGGALALVHLIGFAEPFGLSVVESLATGTPVIAFPLGSMPELVRDGRTGFLVRDVDEAVDSVGRVALLRRQHCRDDVEQRFTASRMVADYAEVFTRIVDGGPSSISRSSSRGRSTKANRTAESLTP